MATLKSFPGGLASSVPAQTAEDRLQALETRLDEGFRQIGMAVEDGRDVSAWERVWLQLLREYEELSDHQPMAA